MRQGGRVLSHHGWIHLTDSSKYIIEIDCVEDHMIIGYGVDCLQAEEFRHDRIHSRVLGWSVSILVHPPIACQCPHLLYVFGHCLYVSGRLLLVLSVLGYQTR